MKLILDLLEFNNELLAIEILRYANMDPEELKLRAREHEYIIKNRSFEISF
jgi:hypothetical protein